MKRSHQTFVYPQYSDATGVEVPIDSGAEKTKLIGFKGEVTRIRVQLVTAGAGATFVLDVRSNVDGTNAIHGSRLTWASTDWVAGTSTTTSANDDTIESAILSVNAPNGVILGFSCSVASYFVRIFVDGLANGPAERIFQVSE